MSVRELLTLLEPLKSVAVPCFDIVELSPLYDSGTTAAVAARLAVEVTSTQIRRRGG
jgi:arginase family enzyme